MEDNTVNTNVAASESQGTEAQTQQNQTTGGARRMMGGQAPRFGARVVQPVDFNFDEPPQVIDQRDQPVEVPVDRGAKAAAKPHTFAAVK